MSALSEFIENGSGPLVWIEPAGYATRAFAGGNPDWMADPQSAAGTLAQANSALKSAVLSVDMNVILFADGVEPDADDPLSAAEDLLESEAVLARAREVVRAIEHTLAGQVDLVLAIPSPARLLRRCGASGELAFDDMDDVGAALANFVRQFSENRFAALMLCTDVGEDEAEDELDTYGAIISTAKHYRWLSILRVDGDLDTEMAAESSVDLVLLPQAAPGDFGDGFRADGMQLGGGLSAAFWQGEDFEDAGADALLYGLAPDDLEPEALLERAASLPR